MKKRFGWRFIYDEPLFNVQGFKSSMSDRAGLHPIPNLEPWNFELLNGRYCGFGLTHGFSSRLYKIPESKNITTSPQSIGS